jgi:drug/metabolite transporter (DMT)-like permease
VIWGVNFPVIKSALSELEPLAFNALRFPLASLVLFLILRSRGRLFMPSGADLPRLIGLGILGNVVYQLLFIYGLQGTLAGNASLLLATTPMWTTLLSSVAGHEAIPPRLWLGLAGTIVGIGLVVLGGSAQVSLGGETLRGDLLTLVASLVWSSYTVLARRYIHRYGSLPVTAWTLWIGTVPLVLLGVPQLRATELGALSPGAWVGVVYAGTLAVGLAYLLWNRGVRRLGNARTALHSNLVPVVALVAAWALIGERPTAPQVVGALIIIGGVSLARSGGGKADGGVPARGPVSA